MLKQTLEETLGLQGKIIFISGASSGIGRAIAELLLTMGANLIVTSRSLDKAKQLVEELSVNCTAQQRLLPVSMDLTQEDSIDEALTSALKTFSHIDVLINNAGMVKEEDNSLSAQTNWTQTIQTNLNGPRLLASLFANVCVEHKRAGNIVNVASIAGVRPAASANAYSVSKAAMIHLTKTMALELARYQIRVNCLVPGYIRTPLNQNFIDSQRGQALIQRIPQRRIGTYQDLALPLLLLVSEQSAYMTGSSLVVDGGHLCQSL